MITGRHIAARAHIANALRSPHPEVALSDVIYDAAFDRVAQPDGEGGTIIEEFGYDCDDLAAVLLPLLREVTSL